ncbi:MAG: hypothetical protein KDD51_00915 [Bdellovibrionales bacterium]|nr:hypothetical protein [Bdellovibrionales bacterium]
MLQTADRARHRAPYTLVVLQLVQDLDVILPVLQELTQRGTSVRVIVTKELVEKSRRVQTLLDSTGIRFEMVSRARLLGGKIPFWGNVRQLVTATESTASPHKLTHALTLQARKRGIPSYTFQHGFENAGLTYFDTQFSPSSIGFGSEHIFIWGEPDSLDSRVPEQIRRRCIPIGRPLAQRQPIRPEALQSAQTKVGIFENLHWERYSTEYRRSFLRDLRLTIAGFPDCLFVIKPHHAGMWFTKENREFAFKNLLVVDPKDPEWEPYTAPDLIPNFDAVITTPSTVALDSASMGVRTAVAAYDLDLHKYSPLPLLRNAGDWLCFIKNSNSPAVEQTFVSRWVRTGNAAERAARELCS